MREITPNTGRTKFVPKEQRKMLKLTSLQNDTLIAALRLLQREIEANTLDGDLEIIMTNLGEHPAATSQDIDEMLADLFAFV
jgi:hypothetical protein